MPIPEPPDTYDLWPRVRAVAEPAWPDADEDRVRTLAGSWRGAAQRFTSTAAFNVDGLRPNWPDDAGHAYAGRLDEILWATENTAAAMTGLSGRAEGYATAVAQVKNGIRELIEVNLPRYELTLGLDPGVRAGVQDFFVNRLADGVREMMAEGAAAVGAPNLDPNRDGLAGLGQNLQHSLDLTGEAIAQDVTEKYKLMIGDGGVTLAEAGLETRAEMLRRLGEPDYAIKQRIDSFLDSPAGRALSAADRANLEAESTRLGALTARANGWGTAAKVVGRIGGVAGLVANIAWDWSDSAEKGWDPERDAKHPIQIIGGSVLSAGAGFWAGAAIGSAIPVPILGTLVGGVVGMGTSLVVSGAFDALWDTEWKDLAGDAVEFVHGVGDGIAELGETITDSVIGGLADKAVEFGNLFGGWT